MYIYIYIYIYMYIHIVLNYLMSCSYVRHVENAACNPTLAWPGRGLGGPQLFAVSPLLS